jgi:hypothetical protein
VHDIDANGNDPVLLALSTLELLNVDDDFTSKLKRAHSSRSYFSDDIIERIKIQEIKKSFEGLFRYRRSAVIPVRQPLTLKHC